MFSLCQHRGRANALTCPSGYRGRGRGRRRDGRRVVRLLPADGGPGARRADREGRARPGREQPRRGRGPAAGRHPGSGAPGHLVPPVLPRAARGVRHRLGLRQPGLPAAVLHHGRGRGRQAAAGHAVGVRDRRGMAGSGRGGRGQPGAGPRADTGRHVLRRRRVHQPAAQRGRLHRGPAAERRHGRRAGGLPRPARRRRPGARGHDQRRRDSRAPRRAHRRPQAGAGGRAGRDPDPGRRGQAPGRGHPAAPRPAPVPGAHGLRPAAPGCTGGRKRAACCSG